MVDHHEDEEAAEQFGWICRQRAEGGEEMGAFRQGGDHHGAGKACFGAADDPPGALNGAGLQVFCQWRRVHYSIINETNLTKYQCEGNSIK